MKELLNRFLHILKYSDLEAIRFFLSLSALVWALLLFWTGDTFSRPTYTVMAMIANETAWAVAFLVQGVVSLYAVLAKKETNWLFMSDALFGCILWTGSCFAMLLSVSPPPAAISAEIVAALASWWVVVRYSGVDCCLECSIKHFFGINNKKKES